MASSLRQARWHFKRMSVSFFYDGIRVGGWPLLCHLSVPAPKGIAESLRSIQRNLTYAILVLKRKTNLATFCQKHAKTIKNNF
jgi:hypothetical protein